MYASSKTGISQHLLRLTAALVSLGLSALAVAAPTPKSGRIATDKLTASFTGGPFTAPNQTGTGGAPTCQDPVAPCDDFALQVDVPANYKATHPAATVTIATSFAASADYDIYLLDGAGAVVTKSAGSGPTETMVLSSFQGLNNYTVRIVPYNATGGETYTTSIVLDPGAAVDPGSGSSSGGSSSGGSSGGSGIGSTPTPPNTVGVGVPRYYNYAPPAGVGENAGEPSLGYNVSSKRAMYISGLQTLRITFPQNIAPVGSVPEACDAQWDDVSYVVTSTKSLDPILYTDRVSGRTFVSQLNSTVPPASPVLIGANSLFAYTDDDGANWTPGQIAAPDGSYDHQTVGAGPYPAALSALANPAANKNIAVYYCSQAGVTAFCSRSDTGGLTFNRSTPIYNAVTDGCGGIHGHVKVAPDGTAYVPNRGCGSNQAVTVSTDGGTTWTVRKVTTSTIPPASAILDPSLGIGSDGTLYFCYVRSDGHPHVAVSHDKGVNWADDVDVGSALGLKKAVFAEAIAGDANRAACGFVAATSEGNHQALDYPGIWYAYVAHTYDAGKTWTTVNAAPSGPVQREGGIWNQGGNSPNRNLLDFNEITVDENGRVLYSFADGCVGSCESIGPNSFTSKATIARQSGGKGVFALKDTVEPALPQRACLAGRRDDQASHLSWREPDTGGAAISQYKIYRGTAPGAINTLIGQTSGKTAFNDRSVQDGVDKYYYRITATNSKGEGDVSNAVALPLVPRLAATGACSLPGVQVISDPVGDASTRQDSQDISSVSMAEPEGANIATAYKDKIVFSIKVVNLSTIPPGFRWAVRFGAPQKPPVDATGGAAEDYFVSMTTADGPTPAFTYGVTSVPQGAARVFTTKGTLDPLSRADPNGTISLVLPKSVLGSPTPGQGISGMLASVRATAPSTLPTTGGTNETIADSTGGGAYTLRQPNLCLPNAEPVARLTATPESGVKPLIVHFDAGASSDPDAIDSIASYTFNFGDGSDEVTQDFPTISHTFVDGGNYVTKLVVADSRGKLSLNTAQLVVSALNVVAKADPFTFIERKDVPVKTFVTSETVQLTGFTSSLPISIDGGGQYSINGGAFTNVAGNITGGDRLTVRHLSASATNTSVTSTVTVGSYSTPFKSTTTTVNRVPDGFSFGSQSGLNPSTLVESVVVTLTNFDTATIVAGPAVEYRINGGSYTKANGILNKGQTLQVRHTTNSAHLGYTKTYLKVGGVTGYFTTRTK